MGTKGRKNGRNTEHQEDDATARIRSKITFSPWFEEWLQQTNEEAKKRDKKLSRISHQRKIIKVLQKYGQDSSAIDRIRQLLMLSGAGEDIAWSVVENSKLLSQYLQMEADGASPPEIALKFVESISRLLRRR
jgi:hypothetical protein